MKKLFLLLTMVAMFATACTESGVDENDEPQNPTEQPGGNNDGNDDEDPTDDPISVSRERVNFDCEGGECKLTVNAEYSWEATCTASWITLHTSNGNAGESPLIFTIGRNTSLSERTTTITLKNDNHNLVQHISVIQTEFTPMIEIGNPYILFDSYTLKSFVEITSNIEYDVTCDADWISYEIVENGINVFALGNKDSYTRYATINITAKEYSEVVKRIGVEQSPTAIYDDNLFKTQFPDAEHITVAELKKIFTDEHGGLSGKGENSSWSNTKYVHIEEDLYIKGKVVSDDEQGNITKSLYVQDQTGGIEIKLNDHVNKSFPYSHWVYVRLKDLYLGNYRMMLSIGGAPYESYNKAGEHKFYANSNIEEQSVVNKHVFLGKETSINIGTYMEWVVNPESVDIITITKENYQSLLKGKDREKFFGRLLRFEGLKCHYAGVANHGGVTAPAIKNGSYDNIYPSWIYIDPRPTVSKPWYRWAFREIAVTADGEEYATGRSLYGSVLFTYRDDLLAQKEGDAGIQGSQDGIYVVRTSGYSRFANRPLCKDGEKATITAFFGIYSKQSTYTGDRYDYAAYQLTLNSFDDMEFENGDAAFLSEEQIKSMTTDDMKYVPWIDEEGEMGEW